MTVAEWIDAFSWVAFRLTTAIAGLAVVMYCAAAMVMAALERVLCVAACLEAAHEARRQGRAPILRAWLRVGTWWRG